MQLERAFNIIPRKRSRLEERFTSLTPLYVACKTHRQDRAPIPTATTHPARIHMTAAHTKPREAKRARATLRECDKLITEEVADELPITSIIIPT